MAMDLLIEGNDDVGKYDLTRVFHLVFTRSFSPAGSCRSTKAVCRDKFQTSQPAMGIFIF